MYITHVVSYLAGWSLLTSDKQQEYEHIACAIHAIDEQSLTDPALHSRYLGRPNERINAFSFQRVFDHLLIESGWQLDYRVRSQNRGIRVVVRNLKNNVGARLLSWDRGITTFPNWLLVDVPWLYDQGVCNISVLVVPVSSVAEIMGDHRHAVDWLTFERCRAMIGDLLPLRHASPFVILAFGEKETPLHVEEIEPDQRAIFRDQGVIEKSIVFPQEYYQAGVSILSYFGEVLRQKHPSLRAKVRIEQEGLKVRLHIETAAGDKEIIEKTLQEYAVVIAEQAPPESLLDGKLQIAALQQKLELANMEIRYNQQLLALTEGSYAARVGDLQEQVSFFRNFMGKQLKQLGTSQSLLAQYCDSNERLLLAHVKHSDVLVRDLLEQVRTQESVFSALTVIDQKLTNGVTVADEDEIKNALETIREESPSLLTELSVALTNVCYGVSGNYVFQWLQAIAPSIP